MTTDVTPLWAHIACCVDESEASASALLEAERLRAQAPGRLSLVHVAFGPPGDPAEERRVWLTAASALAGAEPVLLVNLGVPAAAVCDWAGGTDVNLIVASAHRGMRERLLLGSFAGHLARHAPCPVLLVRPPDD